MTEKNEALAAVAAEMEGGGGFDALTVAAMLREYKAIGDSGADRGVTFRGSHIAKQIEALTPAAPVAPPVAAGLTGEALIADLLSCLPEHYCPPNRRAAICIRNMRRLSAQGQGK